MPPLSSPSVQPKLLAQVEQLFKEAAKVAPLDASHQTVTLDDLRDLVNRKLRYYPQVRRYSRFYM